jgi:AraC-like DNA-binding protein
MTLIAALLPKEADRSALEAAADQRKTAWARSWRELDQLVKREPVVAAIADLNAEGGKDGALRVYRFTRRYPRTPLVILGDMDARDLFRVGKAGATDVILAGEVSDEALCAEVIGRVSADPLAGEIDGRIADRVGAAGRALVQAAASGIPEGIQVPDLAAAHDMSVSTLERRCVRWGLPTPGHLLLWLRIVYGLHWLMEPGRSVESVATQLGYSSGAAFRRAIKVTIGGKPTPLRNPAGLEAALTAFAAACPGDAGPVEG